MLSYIKIQFRFFLKKKREKEKENGTNQRGKKDFLIAAKSRKHLSEKFINVRNSSSIDFLNL